MLLDAEVQGEAVAAGLVGERPVGATGRTLLLSAEYRPPQIEGLSFDMGINSYGERIANTSNSLKVPPMEVVNLGVRYRTNMGRFPATLRMQVVNLFNEYAWKGRASNAFFYSTPDMAIAADRDL